MRRRRSEQFVTRVILSRLGNTRLGLGYRCPPPTPTMMASKSSRTAFILCSRRPRYIDSLVWRPIARATSPSIETITYGDHDRQARRAGVAAPNAAQEI